MRKGVLYILVAITIVLLIRYIRYRRRDGASHPLPPGPIGLPLLGNIFNFPKTGAWLLAGEWRKKYGNVVYMHVLGTQVIFLNSFDVAMDLLDKRSLIYSARPPVPMLHLMGLDWTITIMPYGPKLRRQRAFLHQFLQPASMTRHHRTLMLETHRLVVNLICSPNDYMVHVRRATAAIIMMISYGHEVSPEEDTYVELADKVMESFAIAGEPGAFLVDFFPFLKYVPSWFPGVTFKRKAIEWHKNSRAMLTVPYEMTKRKIHDGTARSSILTDLIEDNTGKNGHIEHEEDIAASAAVTYAGGSDTTVSAICSFLLAVVLHPGVQKCGQEELFRVIGHDRLPTFEDRPALPYIEGIVKETFRWNPVVPAGAVHALEQDDVYKGYFIPAGTIVVPNQWAMLHDETEYPEPFAFKPERWILKEGQRKPRDPSKAAFGFGRRICPGKDLADESVFIAIVTILATLDVQKALDEYGKPITPIPKYRSALISHPERFDCAIKPRFPETLAVLREAIENEQQGHNCSL